MRVGSLPVRIAPYASNERGVQQLSASAVGSLRASAATLLSYRVDSTLADVCICLLYVYARYTVLRKESTILDDHRFSAPVV